MKYPQYHHDIPEYIRARNFIYITSSEAVTSVPCPECGRTLSNGEWLSLGVVRKNDICTCPEHGDFLVKVVCKRASADRWTVTRSVYKSDDEALESYQKKIEKQHAAIERRKAAAEKGES